MAPEMPEMYDAATPAPGTAGESVADRLKAAESAAVEADLERAFSFFDVLSAELAADVVDPGTVALLDSLTGAADAPLEWASLHRRVHEGILSWQDFWSDPTAQPGGTRLFAAVNAAQLRATMATMATWPQTLSDLRPPEPETRP